MVFGFFHPATRVENTTNVRVNIKANITEFPPQILDLNPIDLWTGIQDGT